MLFRIATDAATLGVVIDRDGGALPRFLYVPWVDSEPPALREKHAVELAHTISVRTNLPLVGVASTKRQLPDDWGKLSYRTRKSSNSSVAGPVVAIHFWPSIDDLASMRPSRAGYALVLEWASDDLSGWARHNRAVHLDTNQVLAPTLSPESLKLYKRIDWNGNNGWHDKPGKRDALRDLRQLRELDELDVDDLAGYMIGRHDNYSIRALVELARRI